jgi:hypothetical protein
VIIRPKAHPAHRQPRAIFDFDIPILLRRAKDESDWSGIILLKSSSYRIGVVGTPFLLARCYALTMPATTTIAIVNMQDRIDRKQISSNYAPDAASPAALFICLQLSGRRDTNSECREAIR